mgnify:CR=1 FL=1
MERDRVVELAFERGILFLGCGPSTVRISPPLVVTNEFIDEVRASLPELPGPRAKRFSEQYGLSFSDASQLTHERSLADYFEGAVEASGGNARGAIFSCTSSVSMVLQGL